MPIAQEDCPFGADGLSGRDCGGETARSATEALRRPHKLTLSSPWLRRTGANLIVPLISAAENRRTIPAVEASVDIVRQE